MAYFYFKEHFWDVVKAVFQSGPVSKIIEILVNLIAVEVLWGRFVGLGFDYDVFSDFACFQVSLLIVLCDKCFAFRSA